MIFYFPSTVWNNVELKDIFKDYPSLLARQNNGHVFTIYSSIIVFLTQENFHIYYIMMLKDKTLPNLIC